MPVANVVIARKSSTETMPIETNEVLTLEATCRVVNGRSFFK